jgi:hypothetical protein
MSLWLKQYGQLINHLIMEIDVGEHTLREFGEAAAPCRSIDLTVLHFSENVDLAALGPVASSLQRLTCQPSDSECGSVSGTSAFSSMSQLTALHLYNEDFKSEEPWSLLAKLTSLQKLNLVVRATGDPSPLSALTGLSHLWLKNHGCKES